MPDETLKLKASAALYLQVLEARKSPLGLYRLVFTDEQGQAVIIKQFHEEWNALWQQNQHLILISPRESTKTSFALALALWHIGRNPNIRIKWLGPNDGQAGKRLATIHEIIAHSSLYHMVFPSIKLTAKNSKRPNSATQLNVERDMVSPEATVEASGVLSSGVGARTDLLIADDVCDESSTILQPSMQPKVISKFLSDWMSTLTAKGRVFYIATPWTSQDLTAYLIKHSGWTHKKYRHGRQAKATSNETGSLNPPAPDHSAGSNSDHLYNSMFPERWPPEVLRQRRLLYGAIHYARAYLCEPLVESIVPISPSFLRVYGAEQLTEEKINSAVAILSIDPAKGDKAHKGKTDFIGVCIALLYLNSNPPKNVAPIEGFIVDAYQFKAPLDVQARHIWQLARDWQAQHILVEAKGMQSLDSWLRLEQERDPLNTPSSIVEPITFGNLAKGQRLMQAVPLLNPPEPMPPIIWFHPRAIAEAPQPDVVVVDQMYLEIERPLREQMLSFPTLHDDVLDAATQLLNWVRMHYSEGTLSALEEEEEGTSNAISLISL